MLEIPDGMSCGRVIDAPIDVKNPKDTIAFKPSSDGVLCRTSPRGLKLDKGGLATALGFQRMVRKAPTEAGMFVSCSTLVYSNKNTPTETRTAPDDWCCTRYARMSLTDITTTLAAAQTSPAP